MHVSLHVSADAQGGQSQQVLLELELAIQCGCQELNFNPLQEPYMSLNPRAISQVPTIFQFLPLLSLSEMVFIQFFSQAWPGMGFP